VDTKPGGSHRWEEHMINNSNYAHWDRLQAKTLDTQFSNEMINGLNCSPFEAEAILEKVHQIFAPLWEGNTAPKLGQIQMVVVDASVPPNVPLAKAKQRRVTLTLQAGAEDLELRKGSSIPRLRQRRLCRMCEEAFQQGGLLTLEDLANLFNCGVRTLVNDLRALRQEKVVPPLRSTVKDMGRAVTHRRLIITLWLEGLEYTAIARKACHSLESVANYVDKFKRCAALLGSGFDLQTTALLVNISLPLAREFQQLHAQLRGVPHRLQELEDFLKKNQPLLPQRRNRR
jgi:hypothetical protein